MRESVPSSLHDCLRVSRKGLDEYLVFARLVQRMPREYWRHRDSRYDAPELDSLLAELTPRFERISALRLELGTLFDLAKLPSADQIETHLRCLRSGGWLRWLSGTWREARRSIRSLAHPDRRSQKRAPAAPDRLLEYAREVETVDRLHEANPGLGDEYQGVDTPIDRIRQLREWYAMVRAEYGSTFSARAPLASAIFQLDAQLAWSIVEHDSGELLRMAQNLREGTLGDVDLEAWMRHSGPSLSCLIERNLDALEREAWIAEWLGCQRVKASLLPEGLG